MKGLRRCVQNFLWWGRRAEFFAEGGLIAIFSLYIIHIINKEYISILRCVDKIHVREITSQGFSLMT